LQHFFSKIETDTAFFSYKELLEVTTMEKRRVLQEIGSRLKQVRKALKLSQQDLASRCGYGRGTYVKNELGVTFPGVMVFHTLGNMYEISLDWLLCNKGSMYSREEKLSSETLETTAGQDRQAPLPGEVKALIEDMDRIPLLRHEVLTFYLRYKLNNRELFDPSPTLEKKET